MEDSGSVVCVCTTLISPVLGQTLESVDEAIRTSSEPNTSVLLVVNRPEHVVRSNPTGGSSLIDKWLYSGPNRYLEFCDPPGIPYARNHGLEWAKERSVDWMGFIDDDCVADVAWLEELLAARRAYKADVVAGSWRLQPSQKPSALIHPRTWDHRTYQFGGRDAQTGDRLPYAFTRSVLFSVMDNPLLSAGLRFDVSRAELGGSDVLFFRELARGGQTLVFANESKVVEHYEGERLTYLWHVKRAIRNVQFRLERSREGEPLYTGSILFLAARPLIVRWLGVKIIGPPIRTELTRRIRGLAARLRSWGPGRAFSPAAIIGEIGLGLARLFGVIQLVRGKPHRNYSIDSAA